MKILFLFKSDFSTVPLGIISLSAVLKENGHQCDFIDIKFEPNYVSEVLRLQPDILAYSVVSYNWDYYRKLNESIRKKYNAFSVFGGPHCSIYPDYIHHEYVDAVCVGEGEQAFVDLARNLSENLDISGIPNLWVKQNDEVFKNEIRKLVENLDDLPFPDYELIRKYRFFRNMGIYLIMTSRGCPYNCPYCINHFYRRLYHNKGKYVRRRSVANVIEELQIAKNKYNTKLIVFNDDVFTADIEWLGEFADRYINEIGLPFEAYIRIGTVDEESIALLSRMGCIALFYGIESGNREIRKNILHRNISNREIIKVSMLLKKYGIKSMAFNMLALPGETLNNMFETLQLNAKCRIDNPLSFIFQPFPNLDLTKYAIESGSYLPENMNFNQSLIDGDVMMLTPDAKQMRRFHYLFVSAVKLKLSHRLIRFLIKLPLDKLYRLILGVSRGLICTFIIYRPSLKHIAAFYLSYPFVRLFRFFK